MNKIIIVFVLLFAISTTAFAKDFIDVDDTISGYKEAISYLSEKEIINGYTDGSFKPKALITRAEISTLLYKAFIANDITIPTEKYLLAKDFEDIKDTWAEKYVKMCTALEIIKGYEDGTFRPNNNVTYGELCAMVCRLLKMDVNEDGDWARAYLNASSEAGLLDNIETNDVIPVNKVARMNVAMIIYNAININSKDEQPSKENQVPEEKPETKPEETKTALSLTPNKTYFGRVVLEIERSVKNSVDVDVFGEGIVRFDVKDETKKPSYGSLLIFYVRKDGGTKIEKELTKDIINSDDMLVVEAAQGSLARLEDIEEALDISLDEYILDGNTIKLGKYDYYLIEVDLDDKDEYQYEDGKEIKQEEIKLLKDDRIIFDTANKQGFIIRGIEEE